MWYNEFDSIFWISLGTLLVGAFGVSVKYCLRSRCENFSLCCGLIQIKRRVDLETQEHLKEIELGINEDEEKTEVDLTSIKK